MKARVWLNKVAAQTSYSAIAEAIGKSPSSVTRWANGEIALKTEDIIAISRAMGIPVLQTLVQVDHLTEQEVQELAADVAIRTFSVEEMIEEIHRRTTIGRFRLGAITQRVSLALQEEEGPVREFAQYIDTQLQSYREEIVGKWGQPRGRRRTTRDIISSWLPEPTSPAE